MARDDKAIPINELLDEKTKEFESGKDKEHDPDLDEMIWELGDYENKEPPQEAQEFKEEVPIEEDLVEKEMVTIGRKVYFKEAELVGEKAPVDGRLVEEKSLRIEIAGRDCEIVSGWVSRADKNKLAEYCKKNDITPSDIWYEEEAMQRVFGRTWKGWYRVDELLHDMGLFGAGPKSFTTSIYVDDEPAGKIDWNQVAARSETVAKPKARKGYVPVTAGTFNESKQVFSLTITDDFEPGKLVFLFKDLKNLGVNGSMLAEVQYGERSMDFSHQDYGDGDVMDVKFLK